MIKFVHTDRIADRRGKQSEANKIAERIYLYSEFFLVVGSLSCAGDLAVEHIAETGYHQSNHRHGDMASAHGKIYSYQRRREPHIGQDNRIIIKAYHDVISSLTKKHMNLLYQISVKLSRHTKYKVLKRRNLNLRAENVCVFSLFPIYSKRVRKFVLCIFYILQLRKPACLIKFKPIIRM